MRVLLIFLLAAAPFALGCQTQQPGAEEATSKQESYDLEVTLVSPFATGEHTMTTTVHPDEPFALNTTNGAVHHEISGVLNVRQGRFLLDLTVVEPTMRDSHKGLPLELGKAWSGGPVASFVYERIIVLRKHESRLQKLVIPK